MGKKRSKKYIGSKCRIINCADMMLYFEEEACMTSWAGHCSDDTKLKSNFTGEWEKAKKNPGFKYFLVDIHDLARLDIEWSKCRTAEERDQKFFELMSTVTGFTKGHKKQIYIRSITPAHILKGEGNRVFADEVLETLPIILRQQETPIGEDDERLEKYRQMWTPEQKHLYKTIEVHEYLKILEEFDVDKKKVAIIQDPGQELARLRHLKNGHDQVKLFSPDMKMVVDPQQAISIVFNGLVHGVNWKNDQCEMHQNCLETMKPKIMDLLRELNDLEKGTFITLQYVLTSILRLKRECQLTYLTPPPSPDYTLKEHTADTECINDVYTHIARFFDLPIYSNYVTAENKETHLPVWLIRIFLKFGWIQQFFGDKEKKIRDAMMDTVLFLAPEKRTLMTEKFMKRTLQKEANELN